MSRVLDKIRDLLPPAAHAGLEEDYHAFRERTGSTDVDLFVQYLFQQGSIDQEQLAELLRQRGDLEVTSHRAVLRKREGTEPQRTFSAMSPQGSYALLGLIAEGSMGEVWIAKDHDLKRKVAFKLMSAPLQRDEMLLRRFVQEAQVTAQLDHPNIVQLYGFEAGSDRRVGYAMKLVAGERTLEHFMAEAREQADRGRIDEQHTLPARLDLLLKVCDAIFYAHSRGVIHRDLKPENVMVGPYYQVYVMDWGLARILDREEPDRPVVRGSQALHTQMGEAIGTPAYMSPEQARGNNDALDARSDLYALGLLLQELVTLRAAMKTGSALEVMTLASKARRVAVRSYGRGRVPAALVAIISKACALKPDQRYADVGALADDIRRFLRDEEVHALPDGPLRKASRVLAPYRTTMLVLALMGMVATSSLFAFSLVVFSAASVSSEAHEEQLGELLTAVSSQSNAIDLEIARYERTLQGMAAAAVSALTQDEAAAHTVYEGADFDAPGKGPPDLRMAPRYGQKLSFAHPSFKRAPTVERSEVSGVLSRLESLRHHYPRALMQLVDEGDLALQSDAVERRLGAEDTPVPWAYIGTVEGVGLTYPGHGGYPESFDPRKRPWYTVARDRVEMTWGQPYVDVNGLGLSLPLSVSLHDGRGDLLGVAGLDVSVQHVVEEMLVIPGLAEGYVSALLDSEGRVVVRSTDDWERFRGAAALTNRALRPAKYEHQAVVDAVLGERSGYVAVDGGQLAVFNRLEVLGWTLVVTGDEDALLAGLQ